MNNGTEQIFLLNAAPSQSAAPTQRMTALIPPPSTQVNLDNVEDFSRVCRICASITELVMPILSGEGLQNRLGTKIRKYLPITVREDDGLPQVICYPCANTLLAWHELFKCCMEADLAMHAKITTNRLKTNQSQSMNITVKPIASVQDAPQDNPIPAPAALRPPLPHGRRPGWYREHLPLQHQRLVLTCEACNKALDQKELKQHVHLHSRRQHSDGCLKIYYRRIRAHINNQAPTPAPTNIVPNSLPVVGTSTVIIKERNRPGPVNIIETGPVKINTPAPAKIIARGPAKINTSGPAKTNKTSVEENEFSDHSDTEGFGSLPESVFEAMEDSQDGQQLTQPAGSTSHAPHTERPKHDSSKSDSPQPNNLTSPTMCLQNNNVNNCSVVIEPMKIALKNRSVINIKVPPENKILPKTAEVAKGKKYQKTRKCPFCPKEYKASSSYFYHLKHSHGSKEEYGCEVCGRKLFTKSSLTQHMATHAPYYEYGCSHCEKRFKSRAGLYIHEQTHKGTKSFACTHCDTAFRWRAQLARHVARHLGTRAHACATCGRAFSVRADLLRHARTHAAGTYTCDKCGQKFAQPRYLKVHTKKKHVIYGRRLSK